MTFRRPVTTGDDPNMRPRGEPAGQTPIGNALRLANASRLPPKWAGARAADHIDHRHEALVRTNHIWAKRAPKTLNSLSGRPRRPTPRRRCWNGFAPKPRIRPPPNCSKSGRRRPPYGAPPGKPARRRRPNSRPARPKRPPRSNARPRHRPNAPQRRRPNARAPRRRKPRKPATPAMLPARQKRKKASAEHLVRTALTILATSLPRRQSRQPTPAPARNAALTETTVSSVCVAIRCATPHMTSNGRRLTAQQRWVTLKFVIGPAIAGRTPWANPRYIGSS